MNPPSTTGYAAPCPTFSLASTSVSQSSTETGTITPTQGAIQYIYTTGYVYNGSNWLPEAIQGSSPYSGYSNVVSTLTLNSSILSTLPVGTIYAVEWDWTWNATMQCYLGPGSGVCNTGSWRLQEFTLTNAPTPTPISGSGSDPLPPGLGWHELANTSICSLPQSQTNPYGTSGGCLPIVADWSSGFYDSSRKQIVVTGAGHGDCNNAFYAVKLNANPATVVD